MDSQYTEDQIQQTNVAKGFAALTYLSDLMKRYAFDLNVPRGGRIFTDSNNGSKLRRKVIKGDKLQNDIFEAYHTRDNQNVVKSTVTISDDGFTPSMLTAALAAKLSADDKDTISTRMSILFLQAAAALLQEQEKEEATAAGLRSQMPENIADEYYNNIRDVQTRGYITTMLSDMLQYAIGANPNLYCLEDSLQYVAGVTDEVHGEGAKEEAHNTINLLHAAIANLGFSQAFTDIQAMSDEIKNSVGEAALVELSDQEQK